MRDFRGLVVFEGMFSESGVLNKISWVFSLQQGLVWHPGAATLTWLSDYDKHLVTGIGLSFLTSVPQILCLNLDAASKANLMWIKKVILVAMK